MGSIIDFISTSFIIIFVVLCIAAFGVVIYSCLYMSSDECYEDMLDDDIDFDNTESEDEDDDEFYTE